MDRTGGGPRPEPTLKHAGSAVEMARPQPERQGPGDGGGGPSPPPPSPIPPDPKDSTRGTSQGGVGGVQQGPRKASGKGAARQEHDFTVGKLYWFLYTDPGAYAYARGQFFCGKAKRVTQHNVTWEWCDGEGTATREVETLQQQGTEALNAAEADLVASNNKLTKAQTRTLIRKDSGTTHAQPVVSFFKEGNLYWIRKVARKRGGNVNDVFAARITAAGDSRISWEWLADKVCGNRDPKTLQEQGATELTQTELRHVDVDAAFSRGQVLDRIARGETEGLQGLGSTRRPATRCLAGFSNFNNESKWDVLLDVWLPKFDPNVLLIRRIDSEAATGDAKELFVQCIRAITNLTEQYGDKDLQGNYVREQMHGQLTMLALVLPILLLRYNRLDTAEERRKKVITRCRQFLRGDWRSLVATAEAELKEANLHFAKKMAGAQGEPGQEKLSVRHERALEQARKGNLSRAMNLMRSPGISKDSEEAITANLHSLHPREDFDTSGMKHPGDPRRHPRAGTFDFVDGAWLNKQLKRSRKGTAVDLFGWDMKEMWAGVQEDQQLLDQAARVFFRPIAEGYLPVRYRDLLAGGRLVALSKFPKPGVRPICVGNAWRRLVAKGLLQMCHESIENFFQHRHVRALQFGGSTKMGQPTCFIFYHALYKQFLEECHLEGRHKIPSWF